MGQIAIRVQDLSKVYRIPGTSHNDTLRDQITESVRAMFDRELRERRRLRSFWALTGISFEVEQGQTVGIIGQNGAGKSTLLKILSQIVEPTRGRAEIYGRVGSLLEVGTGFHPELTGRENIYLNGAIIGMAKTEIQRLFNAIVDFAEIGTFIDMPVKRYSSGMYVRLAFAVSAHLRPEILMIDEVLSVGDLHFQRKCLAYAEELRKSNSTILFVSHNMFAVKSLCSRVIFLNQGEIHYDGEPAEAIKRYESESKGSELPWARSEIGQHPSEWSVFVTDVEIFDERWQQKVLFDHGERMRVRLRVNVRTPLKNPNFLVSFIRSDELPCCNFNTFMDGFTIPSLSSDITVDLLTPPLKLVAESYKIYILVRDEQFQHLYCAQLGKTFHVRHDILDTHFGVFHEQGVWSIQS